MARRGENIRKRKDGRWEGRYIKARTSEGKIQWGYVYGTVYAEVKRVLIQKKAEAGFYKLKRTDLTFEALAEVWLHSLRNSILSTSSTLQLSKASVTSYLPYQKGVYFPSTEKEKISVGAERQRRYRAVKKLRAAPTEEHLWETVLIYQKVRFKTYSGLPFSYEIRKGRSGEYTKELWIDRRENSKSLAWSSVLLALGNVKEVGAVVDRPKALGDIRGVTYIYGVFYRFGLIDVPDEVKEKMNKRGYVAKS